MSRRGNDILSLLGGLKITKSKSKSINPKLNPIQKPTQKSHKTHDSLYDNWVICGTHLLYHTPTTWPTLSKPIKIASFDLDGTVIRTISGQKFARHSQDWQWFNDVTKDKILQYQLQGYLVVIFTNQGAVVAKKQQKSFINFVTKLNLIKGELGDSLVFLAPKRPASKGDRSTEDEHNLYRKPALGMWEQLIRLIQANSDSDIDLENSFYCGDAAGRESDFNDSDKEFAKNIGINFYTPEELFK